MKISSDSDLDNLRAETELDDLTPRQRARLLVALDELLALREVADSARALLRSEENSSGRLYDALKKVDL